MTKGTQPPPPIASNRKCSQWPHHRTIRDGGNAPLIHKVARSPQDQAVNSSVQPAFARVRAHNCRGVRKKYIKAFQKNNCRVKRRATTIYTVVTRLTQSVFVEKQNSKTRRRVFLFHTVVRKPAHLAQYTKGTYYI